jgi:predicted AAA+ superfamily ATPase
MNEITLDGIFDSPTAKLLDFCILNKGWPFTTSMAEKYMKVSFKTTSKAIERLEELKILEQTDKIRNAKAYKRNPSSDALWQLYLKANALRGTGY